MGLSPIASLLPLTVSRAVAPDLEPLPMARVEDSPRMGDETYSHGDGQSAGSSGEDCLEDDVIEVEIEDGANAKRLVSIVADDGTVNAIA
jgi:hypothetical protein